MPEPKRTDSLPYYLQVFVGWRSSNDADFYYRMGFENLKDLQTHLRRIAFQAEPGKTLHVAIYDAQLEGGQFVRADGSVIPPNGQRLLPVQVRVTVGNVGI